MIKNPRMLIYALIGALIYLLYILSDTIYFIADSALRYRSSVSRTNTVYVVSNDTTTPFTNLSDKQVEVLKAYKLFRDRTPKIESVPLGTDYIVLDNDLIYQKLLWIESDMGGNYNNKSASGVMQIEELTFQAMKSDRKFRDTYKDIEKKYGVHLANYKEDDYTNIVAAYAVMQWKFQDVPHWFALRSELDGGHDTNYAVMKIYYNSTEGSTTYKKWVESPYIDLK